MDEFNIPATVWFPVAINAGVVILGIIVNIMVIERVKAKLSLKTQHKLNVKKHETEAILKYDKILSNWILNLFSWNPYRYNINTYNQIKKDFEKVKARKYQVRFNDTSIQILLSERSIYTILNKLISDCEKYEKLLGEIVTSVYERLAELDEEYHTNINIYEEEAVTTFNSSVSVLINGIFDNHKTTYENLRKEAAVLYKKYQEEANKLIYKS